MSGAGTVTLVDDDPNGLATLLAGLLEANLARGSGVPAGRGAVEIEGVDAGVAATVRWADGSVRVANGPARPRADVSVRGPGRDLIDLAAVPLVLGVPSPVTREGRVLLRAVATGRVRIRGMLRHPVVLSRFARMLSAR